MITGEQMVTMWGEFYKEKGFITEYKFINESPPDETGETFVEWSFIPTNAPNKFYVGEFEIDNGKV